MRACYAILHISVPVTVTLNRLKMATRAPFMALVNGSKSRGSRVKSAIVASTDEAAPNAKSWLDVAGRIRGLFKKILHLRFPPVGMQVHGRTFLTEAPHGNTAFPVFGHRLTSHDWMCFSHMNANDLSLWTVGICFFFCVCFFFFCCSLQREELYLISH